MYTVNALTPLLSGFYGQAFSQPYKQASSQTLSSGEKFQAI